MKALRSNKTRPKQKHIFHYSYHQNILQSILPHKNIASKLQSYRIPKKNESQPPKQSTDLFFNVITQPKNIASKLKNYRIPKKVESQPPKEPSDSFFDVITQPTNVNKALMYEIDSTDQNQPFETSPSSQPLYMLQNESPFLVSDIKPDCTFISSALSSESKDNLSNRNAFDYMSTFQNGKNTNFQCGIHQPSSCKTILSNAKKISSKLGKIRNKKELFIKNLESPLEIKSIYADNNTFHLNSLKNETFKNSINNVIQAKNENESYISMIFPKDQIFEDKSISNVSLCAKSDSASFGISKLNDIECKVQDLNIPACAKNAENYKENFELMNIDNLVGKPSEDFAPETVFNAHVYEQSTSLKNEKKDGKASQFFLPSHNPAEYKIPHKSAQNSLIDEFSEKSLGYQALIDDVKSNDINMVSIDPFYIHEDIEIKNEPIKLDEVHDTSKEKFELNEDMKMDTIANDAYFDSKNPHQSNTSVFAITPFNKDDEIHSNVQQTLQECLVLLEKREITFNQEERKKAIFGHSEASFNNFSQQGDKSPNTPFKSEYLNEVKCTSTKIKGNVKDVGANCFILVEHEAHDNLTNNDMKNYVSNDKIGTVNSKDYGILPSNISSNDEKLELKKNDKLRDACKGNFENHEDKNMDPISHDFSINCDSRNLHKPNTPASAIIPSNKNDENNSNVQQVLQESPIFLTKRDTSISQLERKRAAADFPATRFWQQDVRSSNTLFKVENSFEVKCASEKMNSDVKNITSSNLLEKHLVDKNLTNMNDDLKNYESKGKFMFKCIICGYIKLQNSLKVKECLICHHSKKLIKEIKEIFQNNEFQSMNIFKENEMQLFECNICNCHLEPRQISFHTKTGEHQGNVMIAIIAMLNDKKNELMLLNQSRKGKAFFCNVCSVTTTGFINALSHLSGTLHFINIIRKKCLTDLIQKNINNYKSDIEPFKCSACTMTMGSLESAFLHLRGKCYSIVVFGSLKIIY